MRHSREVGKQQVPIFFFGDPFRSCAGKRRITVALVRLAGDSDSARQSLVGESEIEVADAVFLTEIQTAPPMKRSRLRTPENCVDPRNPPLAARPPELPLLRSLRSVRRFSDSKPVLKFGKIVKIEYRFAQLLHLRRAQRAYRGPEAGFQIAEP